MEEEGEELVRYQFFLAVVRIQAYDLGEAIHEGRKVLVLESLVLVRKAFKLSNYLCVFCTLTFSLHWGIV